MPNGILIFGANGCGKTTIGRKVAKELHYKQIDAEDYFFRDAALPYSAPRAKSEAIKLMLGDIEICGSFVLSSVTGDYGETITAMYGFAVLLYAPLNIRLERISERSKRQFGERVAVGGDLYEQEQKFMAFVKERDLRPIDEWAKTLKCPVLKLDATKEPSVNVASILREYKNAQRTNR